MKKIELLAPAGDFEKLKIAFHYGADAVYLGGHEYSLRANAQNFSLEQIKQAVKYAHKLQKKVYVAVNIFLHNEDLANLENYLRALDEAKVDALIVSDILIIKLVKKLHLTLEIHLSTQTSTLNYEAVNFWKELGVTRIVLARECSKANIAYIKEKTQMELECFLHGAMCSSLSGKCILSNYLTNRDSNRGGCAQICRWTFKINNQKEPFSLRPKDLNMVNYLKEMLEIGVNSFKIEGRMRSIYYLATVILTYRQLIDKLLKDTLTSKEMNYQIAILNRCANRDSVPQFFDKFPTYQEQYFLDQEEISNQDFLGIVLTYDETKKLIKLEQRNYFKLHDIVEFFGPNLETFSYKINRILNENLEEIEIARHPQMICYLECDKKVSPDDMMRIKAIDKMDFI